MIPLIAKTKVAEEMGVTVRFLTEMEKAGHIPAPKNGLYFRPELEEKMCKYFNKKAKKQAVSEEDTDAGAFWEGFNVTENQKGDHH